MEWNAMLVLGAYHGINPGMGWLFAVALGMQQGPASCFRVCWCSWYFASDSDSLSRLRSKANDYQRASNGESGADQVGGAWSLLLGDPQPDQRGSDIDTAVRSVRATCKCGINTRQGGGEPNDDLLPKFDPLNM